MRHRFRTKSDGKTVRFRCKRCGAGVEMMARETADGRSPYDVLRKESVPTDCDEVVARRVMDS